MRLKRQLPLSARGWRPERKTTMVGPGGDPGSHSEREQVTIPTNPDGGYRPRAEQARRRHAGQFREEDDA